MKDELLELSRTLRLSGIGKATTRFPSPLQNVLNIKCVDVFNQRIAAWLAASDPFSIHDVAIKKRHKNTGQWFINTNEFQSWKDTPESLLWVHGIRKLSLWYGRAYTNCMIIAGCGKTILW